MTAYYNEIEPYAAEWLNNLILEGSIAPGVVDTRSIEDVTPGDLAGFTQCHFFAGIGVWSYALRLAGWPDDREVWTGSCPCQPFSAAGKGKGAADERHLWPAWHWLIAQCRPRRIFGEQVEAAIKHDWLDLVQADLEGIGYAVGAVGLPAAGVGAPHARARLYFVADTDQERQQQYAQRDGRALARCEEGTRRDDAVRCGAAGLLGDTNDAGPQGRGERGDGADQCAARPAGVAGGVADSTHERLHGRGSAGSRGRTEFADSGGAGFWSACDWIPCSDGKARPVEPGTFPLAHGAPARVGRLRAYGNAIVAPLAAEVIRAYMDARP